MSDADAESLGAPEIRGFREVRVVEVNGCLVRHYRPLAPDGDTSELEAFTADSTPTAQERAVLDAWEQDYPEGEPTRDT